MSKVALSGNASGTGTFTIASPNSNTDRTLTLPDQTGTILTGSGAIGVNASAPTNSLAVDASGNLLMGISTNPDNNRLQVKRDSANAAVGVYAGTTGALLNWYKNDNTYLASVTFSGSTVTYGTGSDYRLKENVQPISNALDKITALKPVAFTWKDDGSYGESFIAHELQELYPTAVNGVKDAVDSEGKPRYQGVDTSKLVAVLTAAIQELKAIVDAQGAEIAALKGTA